MMGRAGGERGLNPSAPEAEHVFARGQRLGHAHLVDHLEVVGPVPAAAQPAVPALGGRVGLVARRIMATITRSIPNIIRTSEN